MGTTVSARWRLIALLVAAALAACADLVAPREPKADDPGAIFDEVWREYDLHYAFFASRAVDWNGVRDRIRPTALSGQSALHAALCRMLDTLHDHHVVLFAGPNACGSPGFVRSYAYDPTAAIHYLSAYHLSASGLTTWGRIGTVGYIRMERFAGPEQAAEIDSALASFDYITGVVIDMRGNGGGNSMTAQSIAGRFADAERPYLTTRFRSGPGHDDFGAPVTWRVRPAGAKRWTGPVALIVDHTVGSAGEDFTMAMRVLPNVLLVGERTSGTASNPLWRELPNGWSYWVPQSMETTIDGITPTVDGGIPPALRVVTSAADSATGHDTMLDSALARLVP